MGFDLSSLRDFDPPLWRCANGLCLIDNEVHAEGGYFAWTHAGECPNCGVRYLVGDAGYESIADFLDKHGYQVGLTESLALEQGRRLARLAHSWRGQKPNRPPLYYLFELLTAAEKFVHVLTWSIEYQMLGALKLLAHKVPVALAVGRANENLRAELVGHGSEAPRLDVRIHEGPDKWAGPHAKLIVVDGLIAVSGSANFTTNAWRKSREDLENIELVTDVNRVIRLNNRYFVAAWTLLDPNPGPIYPVPSDNPFDGHS